MAELRLASLALRRHFGSTTSRHGVTLSRLSYLVTGLCGSWIQKARPPLQERYTCLFRSIGCSGMGVPGRWCPKSEVQGPSQTAQSFSTATLLCRAAGQAGPSCCSPKDRHAVRLLHLQWHRSHNSHLLEATRCPHANQSRIPVAEQTLQYLGRSFAQVLVLHGATQLSDPTVLAGQGRLVRFHGILAGFFFPCRAFPWKRLPSRAG